MALRRGEPNRQTTTPVGSLGYPNPFGLYDIHGNVWEWCTDHWHETYTGAPTDGGSWETAGDTRRRVLRGGSYYHDGNHSRAAMRAGASRDRRSPSAGFRVVAVARKPPTVARRGWSPAMTNKVPLLLLLAAALGCSDSRIERDADLPAPNRVLRVPAQYTTIQAAVMAARVGDRILVRPGTYLGTVVITGAARNDLQIVADGGSGQVILQGNHMPQTAGTCRFALEPLCPERAGFLLRDVAGVIIRGFMVKDFGVGAMSGIGEGFLLVNAHRNRIEQNVVTRTDMMGITLFNSSENLVERNSFYGNDPDEPMRMGTGCGVHIQDSAALSAGVSEQNVIRQNVVYGNPFAAVMLRSAGSGNQIVNNEFRDGGAWGVTNRTTNGTLIENNRITNHRGFKLAGKPRPVGSGVGIDVAGSSEAVIRNNALQNNSAFDIEWDGTGQNTFAGNRCTKASRDGLCGL